MKNDRLLQEVNSVLQHVSTALNSDRNSFFLYNKKQMVLETVVAQGIYDQILCVPISRGIVGSVFSTSSAIIENEVQKSELFYRLYDELLGYSTKTTVCVPVFDCCGQTIGVLQALNKINAEFDEKDISILAGFAATISLIVKNTKLYLASEEIKNNFSKLLEVFGSVSSELDLDNLIQVIIQKAAEITQSDRSSLFFKDEENGEVWSRYTEGLKNKTVRTKKRIVKLVAENKIAKIVNDPYNHPFFDSSINQETGYRTKSLLSVPVFSSDNKILGIIQVINKIDGIYKPADQAILESFASQIRIAVENARLFEQINGMKNYLNILIENLDNGIVTIDKSKRVQTINNTFYRMFDLDGCKSLVNKRIGDLDENLKAILNYSEQTMETGKKHYEYSLRYQTKKGRKVTTNLSILPMHDPNGKIIGAVNVFQDVTRERRIRSNLSRYIPKHLVNEVINKDDLSILRSKSRKCTILFSDIRNFTKLTEELGAIQIVKILNTYFDAMVTSIHHHNGILDKFIGDAVMAVFGIPYTNSRDSNNAVMCALNMFKLLEEFNKNKNIGVGLNIGIGISTGNVISGNIGSEKRFEYTVVGDPVNLAARLENETKKYNVKILICENTYRNVSKNFHCREIDSVLLRGRQKKAKVYTVDGAIGEELFAGYDNFCNYYSKGLKAFQTEDYSMAKKEFVRAKKIMNNDGPVKLMLARCDEALKLLLAS